MTELKTQEKERIILSPNIHGYADDEELIYHIEVELPGVDKENISIKMLEDSFYVRGETEKDIYVGSYGMCCLVRPKDAKAVYRDGLLKIDVPFKDPMEDAIEISIQ
ncbi:MAG: Hsp20/alpha crystallin family protein [Candidatus Lokiarchaeota archaeon]|nr:Hsp20/alpha crystallin family protein [Candidatus Lokiarchaeota archaeon]